MHLRPHDTEIHEEILAINFHFVNHKISRFRTMRIEKEKKTKFQYKLIFL